MNSAIYLGSLIFALAAFVHLARIFCPFEIIVGGSPIPQWVSYLGFIIFGLLSVYLFSARHRHHTMIPPETTLPKSDKPYP